MLLPPDLADQHARVLKDLGATSFTQGVNEGLAQAGSLKVSLR